MVVDDSASTRRITIRFLKLIGYEVIFEAADGKEGLKKLKSKDIDLVITDWNMPNMNGLEFVKAIRADEKLKKIPVLMVTTRGLKEDVINAIKVGANNYIVKPFTQDILNQKILQVIGLLK